jgi:3-methyladenine DNA glycosylase AlkC
MAEPWKDRLDGRVVAQIAAMVKTAWPAFPSSDFQQDATTGLGDLELKARVAHIADSLRRHLPATWPDAAAVLLAALPPLPPGEAESPMDFAFWPLLTVVERHGGNDPARSLPLLREMTRRFSAEFAIRPLLRDHPDSAWAAVSAWASDPDARVRRLATEGTRPRLPWGLRLHDSVRDPRRGLAVLDRLVDDPAEVVRRSVANHLGDVAKDHPSLAVTTVERWLQARPDREPLGRHALRDLLKKGDRAALSLFGHGDSAGVDVRDLRVEPVEARVGEVVVVSAVLAGAGPVRVDLRWEWPAVRGVAGRNFAARRAVLRSGEPWEFRYRLSLRPVTTRPLRPGEQKLTLRVNGQDHGPIAFRLLG